MSSSSPTCDLGLVGSPHLAGRQMSSSLKEKLKKMGRSRSSPLASPANRRSAGREKSCKIAVTCTSIQNSSVVSGNQKPVSRTEVHLEKNETQPEESSPATVDYESLDDRVALEAYKKTVETRILQKRESMRKLELAKLYRTKNDLSQLDQLIEKWRQVSQDGIQELHDGIPDPKPSLTQLIDHLQIDHELIGYVPEEESFIL